MKRFAFVATVLLIAGLVLTGCGGAQPAPQATAAPSGGAQPAPTAAPSGASAQSKQLVIAMDVDVVDMDPARAFSDTYLIIGKAMYDQLTELDPKDPTKINPQLAEKWEISPDGKVYTFQLRKGVKFPSGNELTSEDVKFSLERLQNLKSNPGFLMDGVEKVEAPDPTTVRFTLTAPDASFLPRTSAVYMAILDSKEAKAHGCTNAADAEKTDKGKEWLDDHSLGSGPFILERWERNSEIRLKANPNYWRGKPGFETVVVKYVKDATTQSQMLQRGDIDIAMNIDPDTGKQLQGVAGVKLQQGLSPSIIYLAMTTKKEVSPEVANQKVRQAVSLSIDYDGLCNQVLAGAAVTPPSVIPNGFLGADSVPGLKRDVAKAKALLAEAGYPNGVKITAHYANLTMFGVDFNVVMQKLQADLKEAGITLELVPQEMSVFLEGYRGGKDAFVIGWQTPDFYDSHANAWALGASDGVFCKRMAYVNPENDKLVADAVKTTDPEARKALYAKLLKNIQNDANFLSLIQPKENVAYRDNIKGFEYHPVVKVDIPKLSK